MTRFRGRRASASAQKACWGRTLTRSCSPPPMAPCVSSLLKHSKLLPRASSSCPRSSWTPSSSTCRAWSLAALSGHAAQEGRGLDRLHSAQRAPAPPSGTPSQAQPQGLPRRLCHLLPHLGPPQGTATPKKGPCSSWGPRSHSCSAALSKALHLCAPLLSGSSNIPEAAAL